MKYGDIMSKFKVINKIREKKIVKMSFHLIIEN